MAEKAGKAALADANVPFDQVAQAYAGYVYGDSTCGQRAIYQLGLTGIPVFNVNNNCSTGSSALMLGAQAVAGGIAECVLVVGFEQMEAGALQAKWNDRANPLDKFVNVMNEEQGFNSAPPAAQMFGGAGREYRWKYGTKKETFAQDRREGAQARVEEPVRAVQGDLLARADHGVARGVRSADALPVLPADLRRRRGGAVQRRVREEAQHLEPRVHRGAGDDDRLSRRASRSTR